MIVSDALPGRVASIKGQAVETEGDLKAVELCQKPSALRTQEDIK